jgi:hypothetical protein
VRFAARLNVVPFPVRVKGKIKIKVKGSGQECPLHTVNGKSNVTSGALLSSGAGF